MKKILIGIVVFSVLAMLLIAADYFALFGTTVKKELDFSDLYFKPYDLKTGAPIFNAHATCYKHRNHEACTERESNNPDTVRVQFPLYRQTTSSWLFQHEEKIDMPLEGSIKIMIIHNDYQSVSDDYQLVDIYSESGKVYDIGMTERFATHSDADME